MKTKRVQNRRNTQPIQDTCYINVLNNTLVSKPSSHDFPMCILHCMISESFEYDISFILKLVFNWNYSFKYFYFERVTFVISISISIYPSSGHILSKFNGFLSIYYIHGMSHFQTDEDIYLTLAPALTSLSTYTSQQI